MVRSKNSCFKIITCGGDSIDKDDFEQNEAKGSMDKRGWSFRKKSTRHRVLSNTVISETPSSGNKESPESTSIGFHAQSQPTVAEKNSVSLWTDEMPPLSIEVNSKVGNPLIAKESAGKIDSLVSAETAEKFGSLSTTENTSKINQNLEESAAICIQASIRGYLAKRALLKLKNVIKLQAAFRGHLERRQAVGALRCVQAIVKMQALVRARRARMTLQGSATEVKIDGKSNRSFKTLAREQSGTKANINYSSTEKLLTNGFARQLLESAPKKKRINIKCDPSRPDSAWKWLERWVSVSPMDSVQTQKPQGSPEHQEQGEKSGSASEVEAEIPAEVVSDSVDFKPNVTKAALSLVREENLINSDADNFNFQVCHPSSFSERDVTQQPEFIDVGFRKEQDTSSRVDTSPLEKQLDTASQPLPVSISNKPQEQSEQPRRSMKRMAAEQPETEGKKFVFGSRKACNPAFVAVQSKFEELSSSVTSGRSNTSSQFVGVESKLDSVSSTADSITRKKELSLAENSIFHEPSVHIGGSECGTELSISSTLDSPDRSEVGGGELEHETEVVEKINIEPEKSNDDLSILHNLDVEAKISSFTSESNSSSQQGKLEDVKGESVEAVEAVDTLPLEQQPERSASDVQIQLETSTNQQAYRSSPEGSPRSHITVPESHGTPSSQVSVKAKRKKSDKGGSSQSRKSLSADKRSPSNPHHDSGARSSTEQLPRDSKNGKRRNSFGSTKPDYVDQDPRDGSSNSLPSYMQATESARAKAHANNSPRSSPDVQDKDIYIKKRHSLPGANGKQVSPRIQRSMSQAQQGAKGNGTLTQEKKWQR